MPYGYIVLAAVIVLTLHYVLTSPALLISKLIVLAVLGFCLACFFWLHRFTLAALFIMVGLGVYLSIYRICMQAGSSHRRD